MTKTLTAAVLLSALAGPAMAHVTGSDAHNANHGVELAIAALAILGLGVVFHRIRRR